MSKPIFTPITANLVIPSEQADLLQRKAEQRGVSQDQLIQAIVTSFLSKTKEGR